MATTNSKYDILFNIDTDKIEKVFSHILSKTKTLQDEISKGFSNFGKKTGSEDAMISALKIRIDTVKELKKEYASVSEVLKKTSAENTRSTNLSISENIRLQKIVVSGFKAKTKASKDYANQYKKSQQALFVLESKKKVASGSITQSEATAANYQKRLQLEKQFRANVSVIRKKEEARVIAFDKKKEAAVAKYYNIVKFKDANYIKWKVTQYTKEVNGLRLSLSQRTTMIENYQKGLESQSRKTTNTVSSGWDKIGDSIKAVVLAGGISAMVYQVRNLTAAMLSMGRQFEDTMAGVRAIAGASNDEFDKLNKNARDLGENTRYTATEVAMLEQNYARLGFSTREILAASEATISLAAATGEDLAEAAEIAGFTIRGFRLDASETGRVVDVMAKSFTSSALNLERFKESMKLIAPIAKTVGLSVENTTTLLAKLADTGIFGSRAGTALRNVLSQIRNENSKLASVLGGTAKNWEEFVVLLQKAKERGEEFKDAALNGLDLRIKNVVISLADMSDSLSGFNVEMNEATGSAKEMEEIRLDTLHGDLLLLKSAFTEVGLVLYDVIAPVLRVIIQSLIEVAKHGKPILAIAGAITIWKVAQALLNLQLIRTIRLNVAAHFKNIYGSILAATGIVGKLTVAFRALGLALNINPWVLFATVIAGIGFTIYSLVGSTKELNEEQKKLNNTLSDIADNHTKSLANLQTLVFTYASLSEMTRRTAAEEELLNETISALQSQYPRYLKNINFETASREDLNKAIDSTTKALEQKMIFDLRQASLEKLTNDRITALIEEKKLKKELIAVEEKISILRSKQDLDPIEFFSKMKQLVSEQKRLNEGLLLQVKIQDDVTVKVRETYDEYSNLARTADQGVKLNIDTTKVLSDLEKIKSTMKIIQLDTNLKIFDEKHFSNIAALTLKTAVNTSSAYKELLKSYREIGKTGGILRLTKSINEYGVAWRKVQEDIKNGESPESLLGVDWITYTTDFETYAEKITSRINELSEKIRSGGELNKEEQAYFDFFNKVVDFQKSFYEKRAKARGEDVKKYSAYQSILRTLATRTALSEIDSISLSEARFKEHVNNILLADEKKGNRRKKLAEQLRKSLEQIESRTAVKDDSKELQQLNKINEYYEKRLALLGGINDLIKGQDESGVDFLRRLKERETLNEKDRQYAYELLAIKRLQKNSEEEITKELINQEVARFTSDDETKAIENARLIIVKGRYAEQKLFVLESLRKEQSSVLKLTQEFEKIKGQTVFEAIDLEFEERLAKAEKHSLDILALSLSNNKEIAKLESLDIREDAQQEELENLKKIQVQILKAYLDSKTAVELTNSIKLKKIISQEEEYSKQYKSLQRELTNFNQTELKNRLDSVGDWYEDEIVKAETWLKGTEPAYKKHIEMLDEIAKKRKEIAGLDALKGIVSGGTLANFGNLVTVLSNLEEGIKTISDSAESNPFQAMASGANLALQITSSIVSGLANIWDTYYEKQLDNINKEKDARLEALEVAKEVAETEARFGFEQRQALKDMEFLANDEIRMAETQRVADQYTELTQIEDRHALAKKKIEEKALAEEKKIRKQQQEWAVTQALINGALAVTNVLATVPFPYSLIVAAITAGLTAVEVSAIKSQSYADGGFTSAIGGRDETGEKVAGTVHEKEMVFEKQITMPNLKPLFALRALLQKGYKLSDIMSNGLNNNFKMPTISIPKAPQVKFASGGFGYPTQASQSVSSSSAQMDELIDAIKTMDSNLEENRPIVNVEAKTIEPIDVWEVSEQGDIDRDS